MARMRPTAQQLKFGMNFWPPFVGAGIRVHEISADFRRVKVGLKLNRFNGNHAGTHFGGSLFAMTDPFFALMMMNNLGRGYIVWDKSARIDFKVPGRGQVIAEFVLTEEQIAQTRARLDSGEKVEPVFSVDIVDAEGTVIATVEKTLYLRPKNRSDSADAAVKPART